MIEAVFSSHNSHQARIPYTITGLSGNRINPVARALLDLLALASSRFSATDVIDLLMQPVIGKTFGFDGDLKTLRNWFADAGICWGLDGAHKAEFDLPEEVFPAGLLLGNALLCRRADTRNRRVLSSDNAQKLIDLLLILEIAHLLSAVELHDQIGQRGENALAGKAALAHRNALVHTRYHGKRNIIPPVNKKAVQIEGMPADAARTDFPTGFFILGKRRVINTSRAERCLKTIRLRFSQKTM